MLTSISTWLGLVLQDFPYPLYPLTGFMLACLLRFSWHGCLPALLGVAGGLILFRNSWSLASGWAVVMVVGALIGWRLLLRFPARKPFTLGSVDDLLRLTLLGGVAPALLGASWRLLVAWWFMPEASEEFFHIWLAGFLSVLASVVVFAPASYFGLKLDLGLSSQRDQLEAVGFFSVLALSILLAFLGPASWDDEGAMLILVVPNVAILWVALRLGLRPVSVALALGTLGVLISFALSGYSWPIAPHIMELASLLLVLAGGSYLLLGAQRDAIKSSDITASLAMATADFCQWEWSLKEGLKFHSAAWTERIGLAADRFLPLEDWIATVHPEDNKAFASAITEGAKKPSPGFNVRYRSRDAHSGKWFWSQSISAIVKSTADQRPLQAVGVVLDIDNDVRAEQIRIEAIQTESELETLRSQLNPHFLFNSLNSIRALIGTNEKSAREMITSLSALLRYLLKPRKGSFETVETEMAVVQRYLSIEQIRFGDSLRVETAIDSNALAAQLPGLVILTLVENAITHGISKRVEGGRIRIEVSAKALSLEIIVSNDGRLDEPGGGIGMENTRRRMELLTGDAALFQLSSPLGHEVVARLTLPYRAIMR